MKKSELITWIIYLVLLMLMVTSCEKYVVNNSDITLSGKYVVSRLDITNVDQTQTRDSLYTLGTTYKNSLLPKPFDSIRINRFYIHLDYSTIRMNWIGIDNSRDIWEYPLPPEQMITYKILSNNAYNSGYLQFTYLNKSGTNSTMTFLIEDDGFETLQLKSSGAWFRGKFGEKQVMTLYLTRVGP